LWIVFHLQLLLSASGLWIVLHLIACYYLLALWMSFIYSNSFYSLSAACGSFFIFKLVIFGSLVDCFSSAAIGFYFLQAAYGLFFIL
jgi:hypothetical protein